MNTLSIAPPPGTGEILTSWLARLSAANHYPLITIMQNLGLAPTQSWRKITSGHDIILTPNETSSISNATGIPTTNIDQLTIHGNYHSTGLLTTRPNRTKLRAWALQNHVWVARTQYCPQCLGTNGQWQTAWKLPYTFTCPTHRTFLHTSCPSCGWGSPTNHRNGHLRPLYTNHVSRPGTEPAWV